MPEAEGDLDEVVVALVRSNRLRFAYQHNDGRVETLTIEPLSLVIFEHQFYVLALRDDGAAIYPYRFARMRASSDSMRRSSTRRRASTTRRAFLDWASGFIRTERGPSKRWNSLRALGELRLDASLASDAASQET